MEETTLSRKYDSLELFIEDHRPQFDLNEYIPPQLWEQEIKNWVEYNFVYLFLSELHLDTNTFQVVAVETDNVWTAPPPFDWETFECWLEDRDDEAEDLFTTARLECPEDY